MIISLITAFVAGALLFVAIIYYQKYRKLKASYDSLYQNVKERQKRTRRVKVEAPTSYDPDMLSEEEIAAIRWELIKKLTVKMQKKTRMEFIDGKYTLEFDVTKITRDESGKSI